MTQFMIKNICFPIVNFPFIDGGIPEAYFGGIAQVARIPRFCSKVFDFNERKNIITENLLNMKYRYHKLLKKHLQSFHRYKI